MNIQSWQKYEVWFHINKPLFWDKYDKFKPIKSFFPHNTGFTPPKIYFKPVEARLPILDIQYLNTQNLRKEEMHHTDTGLSQSECWELQHCSFLWRWKLQAIQIQLCSTLSMYWKTASVCFRVLIVQLEGSAEWCSVFLVMSPFTAKQDIGCSEHLDSRWKLDVTRRK